MNIIAADDERFALDDLVREIKEVQPDFAAVAIC